MIFRDPQALLEDKEINPNPKANNRAVIWVAHGNSLLRCHPIHLRNLSDKETLLAQLKGLEPVVSFKNKSDMVERLGKGTFTDLTKTTPSQDDLSVADTQDVPEISSSLDSSSHAHSTRDVPEPSSFVPSANAHGGESEH